MADLIPQSPSVGVTQRGGQGALASGGHRYGRRVHLAQDPWTHSALAKLSSPDCTHMELVALVRAVTARLATEAISGELPTAPIETETRMATKHGADLGTWRGTALEPRAPVVVVDVIRGGMLPSQTVFELLSLVMPIDSLRLDHLNMQRVAGPDGRTSRVDLSGSKIGGSIEGATLFIPDPMGATGATMVRALGHLMEHHGSPRRIVMVPLIVTPEFLRTVLDFDERVRVYGGRVDRGMSSEGVLAEIPGTHWEDERGLDGDDYIVPGAGGVGEVLNNSWA